jgi:hypothetical protein
LNKNIAKFLYNISYFTHTERIKVEECIYVTGLGVVLVASFYFWIRLATRGQSGGTATE